VSARVSTYSLKTVSRPASEVRGDDKRIPVHTITLNLAEYTTTAPTTPKLAPASVTVTAPTPVSSAAKPPKPEKPAELAGRPLVSEDIVVDLS
jgi:hypothetical protein